MLVAQPTRKDKTLIDRKGSCIPWVLQKINIFIGKRLIDRRRPKYKHPITGCSTLDTFTSIFKLA